jgi:hypothetical protein
VGVGALGVLEKVPFFEEPSRMVRAMADSGSAGKFLSEFLTSMVAPPDLTNIAKLRDVDPVTGESVIRKPEGPVDMFKMKVPGLREQVPINYPKEEQNLADKYAMVMAKNDPEGWKEWDRDIARGVITQDVESKINHILSQGATIQTHVKGQSFEEALKTYERATPVQREMIWPIIDAKSGRLSSERWARSEKKVMQIMDERAKLP